MGIVNANPDSFSDSVRLDTLERQVEHALELVAQGADLIDVGGESGVTYTGVTAAEVEIERVVPLVERLRAEGVLVSVDTWKPAVAPRRVDAGAAILNDVSGLRDPELADVAARTGCGARRHAHARRAQAGRLRATTTGGVVDDVERFLRERIALARRAAASRAEQMLLDPGPGLRQDAAGERRGAARAPARCTRSAGRSCCPSRASTSSARSPAGRPASASPARSPRVLHGAAAGAAMVRVHDVAAVVDALRVWRVLEGLDEVPDFDTDDDGLKWIRAETR